MKLIWTASLALAGVFPVTFQSQTVLAVPPTDDLTYVQKTIGQPFRDSQLKPAADLATTNGQMRHLILRPKSAKVLAGAAQITGVSTLVNSDQAHLEIMPPSAGQSPTASLLVDFGEELAGRLQISGTAGAPVVVTTGESLEECFHPEPKLDNSGSFKLVLSGLEPASTPYSAFRFAVLSFPAPTPVELTRLVCDHKYYPVQYWGSFNCSDPLLRRIWYVGAYTAHLCMQEEIWDAPKRDRGLWIGDLQVTGQTINNAFADTFLMEHSLAMVRDQAQGGRPPSALPVADVNHLPGYSAAWFCALADFYRHAGDTNFLARQHEKIVSLLEYQKTLFDTNDLFVNPHQEWNYCDWAPGFVLDNPLTRATTQFCVIYGVHEAVYLLRELGDTANAEIFSGWADQLARAAHAHFFTPASQTYGARLQLNIMAVLSGVASPAECAEIYPHLLRPGSPAWTVQPDRTRHDDDPITPYYGYFLLQAMSELDQHPDALNFIRHYWGDLLRRGATTWWEKFNPAWPDNMKWVLDQTAYLSLCHGWASGPTTYLTENVLGVQPTGPGFATVQISPHLVDLTWAEGDVPTPHGVIHVRVERQAQKMRCRVTLPPGVVATIRLGGKTITADHAGTFQLAPN